MPKKSKSGTSAPKISIVPLSIPGSDTQISFGVLGTAGKCILLTEKDGKDAGGKYFACPVKKPHVESGDKIIMPQSALDRLNESQSIDPKLYSIANCMFQKKMALLGIQATCTTCCIRPS
ncbi:hypothetical protein MRB53_004383 [Persea americana]|uniref:Uncharacterized protein n=1 Tax=Persea americana TaxID=3435 RepID=A0ACC2MAD6_PERAE|nr:hypothetical protein MRB53_004383 [Persea americana]